jgi:hypothetical protein
MPTPCDFPGCGRPALALRLCRAHYSQQRRGAPLTPLRGPRGARGPEPMVGIGIRVPAPVITALERRGPTVYEAARAVLEEWARGRTQR